MKTNKVSKLFKNTSKKEKNMNSLDISLKFIYLIIELKYGVYFFAYKDSFCI